MRTARPFTNRFLPPPRSMLSKPSCSKKRIAFRVVFLLQPISVASFVRPGKAT
jgi:hypothetical protein